MARSLAEIMSSLNQNYDPQRNLVQSQIDALPGQQSAEQAGLDTAKSNAFGSITDAANQRGVVYSGVPINEQNKYVGEKYLPAVANLKSTYANKGSQLQASLLGIADTQRREAQGTYNDEVAQDQARAKAIADEQYRQQQLAAQSQRQSSTVARAAAAPKAITAAQQKAQVLASFQEDLGNAFQGVIGVRPQGYTENVVLPQLKSAYPELDPKQITQMVYDYRKAYNGT